jgi:uncharacterized protein YraI
VKTLHVDADGHRASSSAAPRPLIGHHVYRVVTLATLFAMLFGGLAMLSAPAPAAAQTTTTTTDYLNLRTGPSLDDSILSVIPVGATVSVDGDPVNDFYPVSYNGQSGYAYGAYLAIGSGSTVVSGGGATGTATVIDGALNLRTGPSTDYPVITVMPGGATVQLTGESGNGFLGVVYNGASGFAYADYLSIGGSGNTGNNGGGSVGVGDTVVATATVFAGALNMRTGPGTGYQVVLVLPDGASVEIMGDPQGGFYPVRYNGTKGWSHGDWLNIGGATTPVAPDTNSGGVAVGDAVVTSATVTTALNLRTGPGTGYQVVLVMPGGASVEVMGDPQNGFYPLRYNGTKGWAAGDWLSIGGGGNPSSGPAPTTQDEIIAIIYEAADYYGQPRADMLRVARCESVLDPNAVNASSGASGLFQFMPSTWATTPYANENIFDARANAFAAGWMWSVGRRNEWTCQ